MSGFEIAGIVLGAFPIAISALETYRDIADQLGLFFKIRHEYKKWKDDLEFHKLAFTRNLKELLLPLVADDELIRELLLAPGGNCWREGSVAELFQKRLQESYGLYMQYIQNIKQALDKIHEVLAVDSELTQKLCDNSEQKPGLKRKLGTFFAREWLELQIYKFKFSKQKNDAVRKKLFGEIQEYNGKLEALLKASDKDVRLMTDRESKKKSEIDMAICEFWKKAKSVFQALASAWICQCQQHGAKLLLQHRIAGKAEFDMVITGFNSNNLGVHKIRISEGDDMVAAILKKGVMVLENIPTHQSVQKHIYNFASDIRGIVSLEASSKLQRSLPLIAVTNVNTSPLSSITDEITNLCSSFKLPEIWCYGYLASKDGRYYVYDISPQNAKTMPSVTLDQILQGVHPLFSRSKRYTLSLIIASTYLQLLDSPWLPTSPKRADIVFHHNREDTTFIEFDQPHINQNFKGSLQQETCSAAESHSRFAEALDHLGIMLLELCFGKIIEDQPWRKRLPAGQNDIERTGFDVLAAREWQCYVNEEAGGDYADAVSWCLGGNRSAPPEKWRQEMLRRVIQPLQRSCDYLAKGGVDL